MRVFPGLYAKQRKSPSFILLTVAPGASAGRFLALLSGRGNLGN